MAQTLLKIVAPLITLLLTYLEQKNGQFTFPKEIVEYMIEQFLLTRCQKKLYEQAFDIILF